jgi:hypothetical protein
MSVLREVIAQREAWVKSRTESISRRRQYLLTVLESICLCLIVVLFYMHHETAINYLLQLIHQ